MAVTIGAAKLGADSAETEELKEKAVIVSMAKQRNAKRRSDSLPSCPFLLNIEIKVSACHYQSCHTEAEEGTNILPHQPLNP